MQSSRYNSIDLWDAGHGNMEMYKIQFSYRLRIESIVAPSPGTTIDTYRDIHN